MEIICGYHRPVPPWESTLATERDCVKCGTPFMAKRATAKYCSATCRNRARSPRPQPSADQRRTWRERRLGREGYRERVNATANARARAVKAWISDFKTSSGCIDCGFNAHPVALDIDHMAGKTANISSLKSIAAVKAEIERHKCVVRCANCHRIKSWETRAWEVHDSSSTDS